MNAVDARPRSSSSVGRVGLVSPAWPAGTMANGIVTYVANIRSGLHSLGVGSAIIANQTAASLPAADRQDVVNSGQVRPSFTARAMWKAQERLGGVTTFDRRLGFAVAAGLREAHGRVPLDLFEMEESLGAARFVKGVIACPMIVRLHGPWCLVSPALGRPDDEATFGARVESERRAIYAADAVSSPSRHALESMRAHYGVDLAHAAVIPNPITIEPASSRWRFETCDKQTVLFVGRFDRLKGGDVVLGAFARLLREVPQARLVFVGPDRGLRDDTGKMWMFGDYLRAHLPAEAAARVQMLGEQAPSVIGELRRRSFVTMLASRFETFSMTAVEALSHGSPLVAPAAAAIVEIVEHGHNGLLFADADAADAAVQLQRLFRDPELAQRLAATGAADAARRFAPEVVARQMLAFYASVDARWRSGQAGVTRRSEEPAPLSPPSTVAMGQMPVRQPTIDEGSQG